MKKSLPFVFLLLVVLMKAQIPAYVPTVGLIGYWPFNGNANDQSICGHNGTVNNATLTTDRFNTPNSAYEFNGLSSNIKVSNTPTLSGMNDLTTSAWIQFYTLSSPANNNEISYIGKWAQHSCGSLGAGSDTYLMHIKTGVPHMVTNNNNVIGISPPVTAFTSSDINQWKHMVGVSSATAGIRFYINGVLVATMASAANTICTSSNDLYFGADYIVSSSSLWRHFPGKIDDIGIWNRALTPCEVNSLYTGSTTAISVASSNSTVCAGNSVTLTASGLNTYTWSPGSATGSSLAISAPSVSTIYTVVGTNTLNGCVESATIAQNISAVPDISVALSGTVPCPGASVSLIASGANTYSWVSVGTGSSVVVNPTGFTTYTVVGTSSLGCSSTQTVGVSVSSGFSITAQASPSLVCVGGTSTLTASGAQNYTWQPGSIPGSVITVTPPVSTTYTVIGESQGCIDTAEVTVNIGKIVNVIALGSFCNSGTINIGVTGLTPNDSLVWSGPGISGTIGGSVISTSVPGNFTVVVTDTVTGCTGTGFVNIPPGIPDFSITPSTTVVCSPGPPINLLVNLSAGLNWAPSAEVSPNTGPFVSVNPSVTTTYTVFATLGSCSSTAAVTISVNNVPSVIPVYGDTVSCYGKTITLVADGAADFHWMPNNVSGATVNVSPTHSTTYTVTGSNGACSNTGTFHVKVNAGPSVNTFLQPPIICIGQTAVLVAVGAPTLAWIVSDPPAISPTVAVSPSATTQYSVVGTSSLGCITIATVELQVINSPAITATASAYSICSGQSATLAALGTGSHTWHPGPFFGDTIVVTPTTSTTYTVLADTTICGYVTVRIQVNNCENKHLGLAYNFGTPVLYNGELFKVDAQLVVNNNSNSQMSAVDLSADLNELAQSPVTFTLQSGPSVSQGSQLSINHNFNGSLNKSLTDTFAVLPGGRTDTIYFSFVMDPHGFSGQLKGSATGSARDIFGIIARDTSQKGLQWDPDNDGNPTNNNEWTPIEIPVIDLFIPSAFSPDGDGINDKFVIKGLNARSADLLVFNRWGNKVYEKKNYDNSWDGSSEAGFTLGKGKLPDGIYYYILQFQDQSKDIHKGFIVMKY
ncbi:MAG: gliding motility-associated C-terminal domain-containing protein [Bacteroidia bacterium]|nr:gliding motility-associated C-terminal domain-containing protein [Bacteroidia bacterium]